MVPSALWASASSAGSRSTRSPIAGRAWSRAGRACGCRRVAEPIDVAVAVVGAGPAGIAAGTRAAEEGVSVVVLDDAAEAGGQIWKGGGAGLPRGARRWIERFGRSGARLLDGAAVVGGTGPERLVVEAVGSAGRAFEVRARALVLATGARERFLPFPGWTLPNVIGVGAAQALVKSGASFRGMRVIVAGSGPLLLPAAATLAARGARLRVVAEQAPARAVRRFALELALQPGKLVQAARLRTGFARARYRTGVWVARARGRDRIVGAVLTDGADSWSEPCDVLCCGYGLVPNLDLASLLGCAVDRGAVAVDERQETTVPGVFAAGEATGIGGVELALVEGQMAGLAAAGHGERVRRLGPARARLRSFATRLERAFALRDELRGLPLKDTLVCRCEDVSFGRLDASWTRRQAKLYTRAGMGPCQGRVCGPALEFLFGWREDSVRVPIRPVALSSFLEGGDAT